ncbi:MAG: hypothetical protein AAFW70_12900 [Cyanobacteria bacterium J06635_10]
MKIFGFKLKVKEQQLRCIEEIMRTSQFVRNKCLRNWMDNKKVNKYDHYKYTAVLTAKYPFANELNSMTRQLSAEAAWSAISRFYVKSAERRILWGRLCISSLEERLRDNSEKNIPVRAGFPRFKTPSQSLLSIFTRAAFASCYAGDL